MIIVLVSTRALPPLDRGLSSQDVVEAYFSITVYTIHSTSHHTSGMNYGAACEQVPAIPYSLLFNIGTFELPYRGFAVPL